MAVTVAGKELSLFWPELRRYAVVTVSSYIILIMATYLLVERFNWRPNYAYLLVVTFVYAANFIANTKYVFKVAIRSKTAFRFVSVVAIFWAANNLVFDVVLNMFNLPYLLSVMANTLIFGGIRYWLQTTLVFKKH